MADLLDSISIELPCAGCSGTYRVSLRQIRIGHAAMDAGCQVRHFADCPPASVSQFVRRSVLADFEAAAARVELAAAQAGGRLVWPTTETSDSRTETRHD